jgi:hypothetical protein
MLACPELQEGKHGVSGAPERSALRGRQVEFAPSVVWIAVTGRHSLIGVSHLESQTAIVASVIVSDTSVYRRVIRYVSRPSFLATIPVSSSSCPGDL